MTWGSHYTYVIPGHMCTPRSRKRQEKESNKNNEGPEFKMSLGTNSELCKLLQTEDMACQNEINPT